jgi:hypothetical protein
MCSVLVACATGFAYEGLSAAVSVAPGPTPVAPATKSKRAFFRNDLHGKEAGPRLEQAFAGFCRAQKKSVLRLITLEYAPEQKRKEPEARKCLKNDQMDG